MRLTKYLPLALITATLLVACDPDESNVPVPNDDRDELIGTWTLQENSQQFGTSTYQVNLVKSGSSDIKIENFYNLGFNNTATIKVDGNDIVIPNQVVSGHTLSGSGEVVSDKNINLEFVMNDGSGDDMATANLNR